MTDCLRVQVSNGVDRRASKLRFALAASIQALGCVAERVVSQGQGQQSEGDLQAVAEKICDALLPYTLVAEEPGSESPHGSLAGDSHWAREGAVHGLVSTYTCAWEHCCGIPRTFLTDSV